MEPIHLLFIPIIQIILGIFVWKRNPRNTQNWSFALLIFSIASWGIAIFIQPYFPLDMQTPIARSTFASASLIASSLLTFVLSLESKEKKVPLVTGIFAIGIAVALLSLTPAVIKYDHILAFDKEVGEYGWAHPVFSGYFLSFIILSLVLLTQKFFQARGIQKYKIGYILLGTTLTAMIGTTTNLILPMMSSNPIEIGAVVSMIGPLSSIFFTFLTAYAILKYRFLDVRVIIRKSFVYSLLIAIFFGFIVFFVAVLTRALENSLDISVWASAAILAVLLSAAYFPFHRTIQRVVTSLFTQSQPPFASPTLPPDVEEMKIKAGALIRKSIPVEKAEMLFLAELPSRGWTKNEVTHLQTYFAHTTKALLLQEIPYVRTDGTIPPENLDHVERVLFSKDLAMIIPLYDREIKLFACMLVGPKAKGIFLADEISYLEAFARTLALRVDQILSETIVFENNRA